VPTHSHTDTDEPTADVEADVFIETDQELDSIIAVADRFLDFSNIGGMEELKERIRSFTALQAVEKRLSRVLQRVNVVPILSTYPSTIYSQNGLAKPNSAYTRSLRKLDESPPQ